MTNAHVEADAQAVCGTGSRLTCLYGCKLGRPRIHPDRGLHPLWALQTGEASSRIPAARTITVSPPRLLWNGSHVAFGVNDRHVAVRGTRDRVVAELVLLS